jgi:hypothetical protein
MASITGVGCIDVITGMTKETIGRYCLMCTLENKKVLMDRESCGLPTRVCGVAFITTG